MKSLLSFLSAIFLVTTALAADSTIGNLSPITTVPGTYRMPWENPGVLDYYITFDNFTNQVLAGTASQGYATGLSNQIYAISLYSQSVSNQSAGVLIYAVGVSNNVVGVQTYATGVSNNVVSAVTYTTGVSNLLITTSNALWATTGGSSNSLVQLTAYAVSVSNQVVASVAYTTGVSNAMMLASNTVQNFSFGVSNSVVSTTLYATGISNAMMTASNSLWIYATGLTNGFVGQAPSDSRYYGQFNGAWKPIPLSSLLTYYFAPTNSSVAANLGMDLPPYTPHTSISFAGLNAGTQVLTNWMSAPGEPGLSFLPAGEYEFHIHAAKTAGPGGKTIVLYVEIWEVSSVGVDIAKIGTTETTDVLAGTETEYRVFFVDGNVYTFGSTASRVVCRVWETTTGGGGTATAALYVGDTADSHIALPGTGSVSTTVTLSGDATGSGSGTIAVTVTNLQQAIITNHVYWTNVFSLTNSGSQTPNMQLKEADFDTNATFAFLGIQNKSTSNYQSVVRTVHNSGGATIGILAPPNTFTNGPLPYVCTNGGISKVLLQYHPTYNYTSMYVFPEF